MHHVTRTLSLLASLSTAGLLAACGGGGGSDNTNAAGSLSVSLTDAPSCGFDAVYVTVNNVRVNKSATAADGDGGWTDIPLSPARKIDLLTLTNGALDTLGVTALDSGTYTQLRLVLDGNSPNPLANSVIVSGTKNEIPLDTPSAEQSGLKLGHEFTVAAGQRVDLVLDFDACKSIVAKGNGKYSLKPVITVTPKVLNGISGFVTGSTNVIVSAQQNGVIKRSIAPNPKTGEFFLANVVPGQYDVVITADARSTAVIATVPVDTLTTTTPVSTATAPFILQTAAAGRDISGKVAYPANYAGSGYVAAQQKFSSGLKATVKYQGVDITTGAYTLANLQTSAPQLAPYSPTLPLLFTTKSDTTPGTGMYTVEASAAGLSSKTATVDLTNSSQTNVNFTLQ